jgi:integrase
VGKLTVATIKAAKAPGRYGDGDALYLLVSKSGSKSWLARVQRDGKQRDIGLGSTSLVSLADARESCRTVRIQMRAGLDPVAERKRSKGIPTFREAAARLIAENRATWKNAKHAAQWLSTLEAYVFRQLGDMTLDAISVPMVRDCLLEIWLEKPETARRVRQRIGAVLDWGADNEYRPGKIILPLSGKGLPKQPKTRGHHAALAYADLPGFMARLRERESMGRLALEAAILTAARSGEVRGATWAEVDISAALWTIPGERMKGGKEHQVPLTEAALRVFRRAAAFKIGGSDLVFPGAARGKTLSDMTLLKVCRDMGLDCVPHGFRATFRTWVADQTQFPRELAEKALAHALPNAVEAAYERSNMIDKRRVLMAAWADFADGGARPVVRLAVAS